MSANYRRLISYIYAYEGGVKGKNVGFAKLETRNGQCRIQVSVRKIYVGSQDTGVYLLSGNNEILIGRIFLRNGAGDFRAAVPVNNVAGTSQTIDQCYGLTIHSTDDSWQSYTTIWEDAVAHAAEVELSEAVSELLEEKQMRQVPGSCIPDMPTEHVVPRGTMISSELGVPSGAAVMEKAKKAAEAEGAAVMSEAVGRSGTAVMEKAEKAAEAEEAVVSSEIVGPSVADVMEKAEKAAETEEAVVLSAGVGRSGAAVMEKTKKVAEAEGAAVLSEAVGRSGTAVMEKAEKTAEAEEAVVSAGVGRSGAAVMEKAEKAAEAEEAVVSSEIVGPSAAAVMEKAEKAPEAEEAVVSSEIAGPLEAVVPGEAATPPESAIPQAQREDREALQRDGEWAQRPEEASGAFGPEEMQREIESGKQPGTSGQPNTRPQQTWDQERRSRLDMLEAQEPEEDMEAAKLWNYFVRTYPKIQAFDYSGGCEILTIKPQDIGLLPREMWTYGNNSFLLHGYYNHRYLILVRLNNQNGAPRFLLGVPGHYYSNEKYMAAMFGFPNFVLSKMQPSADGRFGYWYTDIRLGD